eukprot:scaffold76374_cov31-Prasinocladus_malaysianus.AAC.1
MLAESRAPVIRMLSIAHHQSLAFFPSIENWTTISVASPLPASCTSTCWFAASEPSRANLCNDLGTSAPPL